MSVAVRILQLIQGRDNPDLPEECCFFTGATAMLVNARTNGRW
ncbi:hypothetical protein [Nostoc sp. LEGE 06077]|nr:hypothetical protein [Nostoc sp. LEGE 06077]